jgi:peptidoglycan/xylan/chitin deacetylase (PgdA/CDA1 family)
MLEHHLDWIGKRYRYVSLDELGAMLQRGGPIKEPVAAVTFDDGYQDVYQNAFPLLKRKGIPGAVFVVSSLVDSVQPLTHDRLYRLLANADRWPALESILLAYMNSCGLTGNLKRMLSDPLTATRTFLTGMPWTQVVEMVEALEAEYIPSPEEVESFALLTRRMIHKMASEGMTIGSHTRTHPLLTNESREQVVDEVAGSRADLERMLGRPVHHFAYPDGRFNIDVLSILAASGYRYAYTTCRHRDRRHPLLSIPRRCLWQNSCTDLRGRFSPAMMSCQVNTVFDRITPCLDDHSTSLMAEDWSAAMHFSP